MTDLQKQLFELRDADYAVFQGRLIPEIPAGSVIGVRVPVLRKFAKEYIKDPASEQFLISLPHKYFDENMLHGLIISEKKDYGELINCLDAFLPFVDNWAVCDTMSPKIFRKYKDRLIIRINEWIRSEHVYTCRFGMKMLMSFFLDEDFKPEYLELPASVRSSEYYVNMMIAWFFATALAKQWDAVLPYMEGNRLDVWTHNKTIQKARESFRITPEQKDRLNKLKR